MKTTTKFNQVLLGVGFILLLSFALIRNDGMLHGEATSDESIMQTTSAGPTFFDAPFYHGSAVTLAVGNYDLVDLNAHGIRDNGISSVKVSPGFKVVAFANPDFTGASIILAGDTPRLQDRGLDHQISSLRISRFTVGATFYSDCPDSDGKRNGNVVSLPVGAYTTHNLLQWGIANNKISGVVPGSAMEVELFSADSLKGNSRLINEETRRLSVVGLNDQTLSIRIRNSKILFSDDFNDGSLANWQVTNGTWQVVNGEMLGTDDGDNAYTYGMASFPGSIVIDADADMIDGNFGLLMDSTGGKLQSEYWVNFWAENASPYSNRYQIFRWINGELTQVSSGSGVIDGLVLSPIPIPGKCHLTVRRLGNTFDIYVNKRRIARHTDPNPLPRDGKVGVTVSWSLTAAVDNLVVRN